MNANRKWREWRIRPSSPIVRFSVLSVAALASGLAWGSASAIAQEALSEATVDRLANEVSVQLQGSPARAAQLEDLLVERDLLTTGLDSRAQLIFNDESLVRIGQNSRFQFLTQDREIVLEEGVAAVATPSGAGGVQVRTPAVVAAVQGSFFLTVTRTVDDSTTDLFVNLYANPLVLLNLDGDIIATLPPGTIALVVDGELVAVGIIDPLLFLERSPLLADMCQSPATAALASDCQLVALVDTPDEVREEFLRSLGPDAFDRLEDLNQFFFDRAREPDIDPTVPPTPPPVPPTPPTPPTPTTPPTPPPLPTPIPDDDDFFND